MTQKQSIQLFEERRTIRDKQPPLWLCLLLDAVGMASYFLPVWGEWTDVVWAPIAALLFYYLFGGKTGVIGSAITLLEEVLPFTDILPLFTIAYLVSRYRSPRKQELDGQGK